MGCEVLWTQAARDDVDWAIRYIALTLGSPQAAAEYLDAFEKAIDDIALLPEACAIGKHPALAMRALRRKHVKRYVILYSYDGSSVIIHRVFHTLQDYTRLVLE